MAQEQLPLFNFYHRYKWTAADFEAWQNGMIGIGRSVFEGLFNGAVMSGFEAAATGMDVSVSGGIAVGSSGYLMVENDENVLSFSAPGSNSRRDLVVARPLLVNAVPITRPTPPFDTVYLQELQDCELIVIQGTPAAAPEYPAKQDGDVALFGVRTFFGQASIVEEDLDFEVRDIYGKNSVFQNNFGRYDERCRPYRSTSNTVGLKPSQLKNPSARGFTYVTQSPSIFPKDLSNNYVHGDTFLNFLTGVISGADLASVDFTPTVPTAGNAIVASICLKSDDTLSVAYGTTGTRTQCIDGIMNQKLTGPGSVSITASTKLLGFVVVYSSNGTSVDEIDVIDTRSLGIAVASKVIPNVTVKVFADSPYTALVTDDIIEYDATGGNSTSAPYAAAANTGRELIWRKTDATVNTVTITGVGVLRYQHQVIAAYLDGTTWRVLWTYSPIQDVELFLNTPNGHGSTNTAIRRFTNTDKNTLGNFATYADSATLGASITILIPGKYAFFYTDSRATADAAHGISMNSANLTTTIATLTYAQGRRAVTLSYISGNRFNICSVILTLAAGDVIRPHDDLTNNLATDDGHFQMVRICD